MKPKFEPKFLILTFYIKIELIEKRSIQRNIKSITQKDYNYSSPNQYINVQNRKILLALFGTGLHQIPKGI